MKNIFVLAGALIMLLAGLAALDVALRQSASELHLTPRARCDSGYCPPDPSRPVPKLGCAAGAKFCPRPPSASL
jgi:hypothetical protein